MQARRASFVVAVVGIIACVVGTSSPAQATAALDEDGPVLESSAYGDGASQREAPVCQSDKHRCGAGPNFVCCEPGNLCCRHKGGILYCAKKKCSPHQP